MKIYSNAMDVSLSIWQEKLLQFIKPSKLEMLWIAGRTANEDKSWIQGSISVKYSIPDQYQKDGR